MTGPTAAGPGPAAGAGNRHLREVVRFLAGGGANTLLTLACYWMLLHLLPYGAAYTLSFALGIMSSYAINTWFVFRQPWSWAKLLAFPLVHLVNYLAGMAVIWLLIERLGVDARIAPVAAIIATLPLNFLMTRRLVKHEARK